MLQVNRLNTRTIRQYVVDTETLEDDDLFELVVTMVQKCDPAVVRRAVEEAFERSGEMIPSWAVSNQRSPWS